MFFLFRFLLTLLSLVVSVSLFVVFCWDFLFVFSCCYLSSILCVFSFIFFVFVVFCWDFLFCFFLLLFEFNFMCIFFYFFLFKFRSNCVISWSQKFVFSSWFLIRFTKFFVVCFLLFLKVKNSKFDVKNIIFLLFILSELKKIFFFIFYYRNFSDLTIKYLLNKPFGTIKRTKKLVVKFHQKNVPYYQ